MSLQDVLEWVPERSVEEDLVRQVDFDRLPAHVAVIMDGNGRWAARRCLPRAEGHRAGVDAMRDATELAAGIRRREFSSLEVTQAHIAQIERVNPAVNAVVTATEAKTQALAARGVQGTGTATDAVTIVWPPGIAAEQFAGPRSRWGWRIGQAVYRAVSAGIKPRG